MKLRSSVIWISETSACIGRGVAAARVEIVARPSRASLRAGTRPLAASACDAASSASRH